MLVSTTLASLMVLSAVSSGVQEAEPESYRLKFAPAKFVFEQMALMNKVELKQGQLSFFTDKNSIRVDPLENRIYWTNSDDDQAEVCERFDVKRVPLLVSMVAYSPYFDQVWRSESTVYNTETFTFDDESFGVRLSIKPRINSDGTVTIASEFHGALEVFGRSGTGGDGSIGMKMTWDARPDFDVDFADVSGKFVDRIKRSHAKNPMAKATDVYYGVAIRYSSKQVSAVANAVEGGCFGGN